MAASAVEFVVIERSQILINPAVAQTNLIQTNSTQQLENGTEPFAILSPRKSLLLDGKSTIRWSKVSGATKYKVVLKEDSDVIFTKVVEGTSLVYQDGPPLQRDTVYSISVEVENVSTSKSKEACPEVYFGLLAEEPARYLRAELDKINESTGNEAISLRKARTLIKYAANSEAIEVLEACVEEESLNTEIYLTLGELYEFVDLNFIALSSYEKALDLAGTSESLDEQIVALEGIARISQQLGDKNKSELLLKEAEAKFRILESDFSALELRSATFYSTNSYACGSCRRKNGRSRYRTPSIFGMLCRSCH